MSRLPRAQVEAIETALPAWRKTHPRAAEAVEKLLNGAEEAAEFVSVTEAAEVFDVTPQTIRNWVDRGWLPSHREHPSGPRKIPAEVLERARAFREPVENAKLLSDEELQGLLRRS